MKRKSGVRKESKKLLDYNGEFRIKASNLPNSFILDKQYIPDCRDQGTVNSCVGYAITNIMQVLNYQETGNRTRHSPGFVYGSCRDKDDKYEGMFIRKTLDYLIELGAPYEHIFPYNEEVPDIIDKVYQFPEAFRGAKPFKIRGYEIYSQADKKKKREAIKNSIIQHNTPILASTDYFPQGPHAICIIGWDDSKEKWKIMNSWGKSYGDNGIGEIDYDSIDWGFLLLDDKNILMPFTDVGEDKWYYNAVEKVFNAGLMNGTSDTTFDPEKQMTRAEMAQVIVNLCKKLDKDI